ncbi:unnamed protein product [Effrenium voratum]|nr:unnamed protein product [Effrenium voratum]
MPMLSRYFVVASLLLRVTADAEACETCDGEASSLLSLKPEAALNSVQTAELSDVAANLLRDRLGLHGADANGSNTNQSNSWQKAKRAHDADEHLAADIKDTNKMPNPEGEHSDLENRTGFGDLGKTLQFMYLKIAELETAIELQGIEFRTAHIDAQKEIHTLKGRLDQKEAVLQQLKTQLKRHATLAQHGHEELELEEPKMEHKHLEAFAAKAKEMHQEHLQKMEATAPELLKDIMLKLHRQHRKDWTVQKQVPKGPKERLVESLVIHNVGNAADRGQTIVDNADVAFVANTAITTANSAIATAEQAVANLQRVLSGSCPHFDFPTLDVSDTSISINFGRQMCQIEVLDESLRIFDFNFGSVTVDYPAPIAAMISMGRNLVNCMSGEGFDIFKCVAKTIGETLLQVVPPFSMLTNLPSMLSEFLGFFAQLASAAITQAIGETTSLVQEAASLSQFPAKGDAPKLVSRRGGLAAHVHRRETSRKVIHNQRTSLAQTKAKRRAAKEEPEEGLGEGAIAFGTTEATPYASQLLTQFAGDEFDSGSCLAFAPAHRSGSYGRVTKRDWQVPSPDHPDFVKLEPWGVPCDNQWAKDNPFKWEGYSFYVHESVIEKCVAVSYSMSAQPVLAFVGGLEFDLMPAPLMEVTTEVCWPDKVDQPDLSLLITTMSTMGITLFKHSIRLHKRFGPNTDFKAGRIKDAIETAKSAFGKGDDNDDGEAFQPMDREALAQQNASRARPAAGASSASSASPQTEGSEGTEGTEGGEPSFHPETEELYLASARYDETGVHITSNLTGHEAAKAARAALGALGALQTEAEAKDEDGLGNHELFELGSPSGALVGFSVKGLLSAGVTQLQVQMKFGPLESPTKTIDLVNLVDQLRVILSAIPYVSQASKQKAIDALSDTHLEAQIPVSDFSEVLNRASGWNDHDDPHSGAVVRKQNGMCSVQALLQKTPNAKWGLLATLPEECRPDQDLLFSVNNNDNPARVDVSPDGRITWHSGGSGWNFISLSNIVFAPSSGGWPLKLENGWVDFGCLGKEREQRVSLSPSPSSPCLPSPSRGGE